MITPNKPFQFELGDMVAINANSVWAKTFLGWGEWQGLAVKDRWVGTDAQNWYNVQYVVATGNALLFNAISIPESALLSSAVAPEQSSAYCTCAVPDKRHNIGAGTLDFYVCRICRKETK